MDCETETRIVTNDRPLAFFLLLSALEFFVAGFGILFIDPDPKNAFLFGFSLPRLILFLFAIFFIFGFVWLSRLSWQGRFPPLLASILQGQGISWCNIWFLLFLIGLLILMIPASTFGFFGDYFERVRPLLAVISLIPFQLSLRWVYKKITWPDNKMLSNILIMFGILVTLCVFIFITKFGITPEPYFWNVAGMPITTVQFLLVLISAFLILGLLVFLRQKFSISDLVFDGALVILLYLAAAYFWGQTPMLKHFNSLRPVPPHYEPYPYYDAELYDTGSLSILMGYGINFGNYIDKPLYMVFLAFLHRLAAFDYTLLTELHAYAMALAIPALYLFGRTYHSRYFGLLIAMLIMIQQRNAIIASHVIASVNPRLLLTEVPTLLGMIAFTWLAFLWLSKLRSHLWLAFLAGSILGAVSLVRLNVIGMLPTIILFSLVVFWNSKRVWSKQVFGFILGFILLLGPWIVTGRGVNGDSYFLQKFQDVIKSRYSAETTSTQSLEPLQASGKNDSNPARKGLAALSREPINNSEGFLDYQEFPGFVVNHTLHNIVTSFLSLPDSFSVVDQEINFLAERPYWDESKVMSWTGSFPASQLLFMTINVIVISIGLAWSWKRWRWAGLVPLLTFLIYCATLGFARVSGSRYIVPINWVVFFYFGIGFVSILGHLPTQATGIIQTTVGGLGVNRAEQSGFLSWSRVVILVVIFCFALATLVPIAQAPILFNLGPKCIRDYSIPPPLADDFPTGLQFFQGQALYPRVQKNISSFTFLSCGVRIPVRYVGSDVFVKDNDKTVIGYDQSTPNNPEIIFIFDEDLLPQVLWSND